MKMVRQTPLLVCLLLFFWSVGLHGGASRIHAAEAGLIFSTWEGFEADKCASIWLMKRFIDKNSVIKFFQKNEPINEGVAFDTPDAKFRRYHNMSTFESLLRGYGLKDPKLIHIGKVIHDIEVNTWEKKRMAETPEVQEAVNAIVSKSKSNPEIIEKSCQYFDSLYKQIGTIRK